MLLAGRQVRGPSLVTAVLDAASSEIARVGVDGLSLDAVAARAGVHKTTLYRRWGDAASLAREALGAIPPLPTESDDETPRAHLITWLVAYRELAARPVWRAVLRIATEPEAPPPLATLARGHLHTIETQALARIDRVRGDTVDATVIRDFLLAALNALAIEHPRRSARARLEHFVNVLLPTGRAMRPPEGVRRRRRVGGRAG